MINNTYVIKRKTQSINTKVRIFYFCIKTVL